MGRIREFIRPFRQRGEYSTLREREYYASAKADSTALPYKGLDAYVNGSFGLGAFRDKSVLDIGCGEGVYSAWIADRGGAAEVIGIELTEHRIRWDYQEQLGNLKYVVCDVLAQDFLGRQFDIVFMNLVMHHLRFELERLLAVVYRALLPGGRLLAIEPNPFSPFGAFLHLIEKRSANEGFLTPGRTEKHLKAAGFDQVKIGYFWRDRRWAKNPLLGSSVWISGEKPFTRN